MDEKVCTGCQEPKSLDDFGNKRGKKNSRCKVCVNSYYKNIYYANPDRKKYLIAKNKENSEAAFERAKIIVIEALEGGCIECGNNDIRVLEFDHLDPSEKEFNISNAMRKNSHEKLKKEIAKCQVLCANCHRIRTAEQFGTWRNAVVYPLADNELKG